MKLFTLERRQTSAARLARYAMGAVFAGVVIVGFVAPWIVRFQYAAVDPGDRVMHVQAGFGFVESVDSDGFATVNADTGRTFRVAATELTEL